MAGKVKPRFKVGQVVVLKCGKTLYRVKSIEYAHGFYLYDLGTLDDWLESEMRPLTAREKGAASK